MGTNGLEPHGETRHIEPFGLLNDLPFQVELDNATAQDLQQTVIGQGNPCVFQFFKVDEIWSVVGHAVSGAGVDACHRGIRRQVGGQGSHIADGQWTW